MTNIPMSYESMERILGAISRQPDLVSVMLSDFNHEQINMQVEHISGLNFRICGDFIEFLIEKPSKRKIIEIYRASEIHDEQKKIQRELKRYSDLKSPEIYFHRAEWNPEIIYGGPADSSRICLTPFKISFNLSGDMPAYIRQISKISPADFELEIIRRR